MNWKIIDALKARQAVITQRMLAFHRRHMHWEPTPEEREYAARQLTRAEIQEQIEAILRQEQEAKCRSQSRRR